MGGVLPHPQPSSPQVSTVESSPLHILAFGLLPVPALPTDRSSLELSQAGWVHGLDSPRAEAMPLPFLFSWVPEQVCVSLLPPTPPRSLCPGSAGVPGVLSSARSLTCLAMPANSSRALPDRQPRWLGARPSWTVPAPETLPCPLCSGQKESIWHLIFLRNSGGHVLSPNYTITSLTRPRIHSKY